MTKYLLQLIIPAVFSFSSIQAISLREFDHKNEKAFNQIGREIALYQIDFSEDLDINIASEIDEKVLNNLLDLGSDLVIVRHIPSLEKLQRLVACLSPYFNEMYEIFLDDEKLEGGEDFDGLLIASKMEISNPQKIIFGSNIRKHFIEFTVFDGITPISEFFVLNDAVASFDDSLKLEQLNKATEFAESIALKGYQIPCILCVKPNCLPVTDLTGQERNHAESRFIGEKIAIQKGVQKDSKQNFALAIKKTASFDDLEFNYAYEVVSKIDSSENIGYACLSIVILDENFIVPQNPHFKSKTVRNSFASMTLKARDDREAKVSFERDADGGSRAEGSLTYSRDNDDGSRLEVSGRGSIEKDRDGNVNGGVAVEGTYKW